MRLLATDALVIIVSVVLAQLLRFGVTDEELRLSGLQSSYWIISVVLAFMWLISLAISQSRALPVLGVGNDEYRRVINSTMATFGFVAICAMLLKMDIARGYLAIALPAGLGLLLVSRHLWRQWLVRKRTLGAFADRALIVGTSADVVFVANKIIKNPASGYHLVGAAVRSPNEAAVILDESTSIPIVSSPDKVAGVVERHDIDTVIVAGSGEQGHRHLKELSWALEESNTSLVVASKLVDVAGPRIHWRPVEGLPLMSVELPQYGGSKFSLKRAFDVLSSGFGLLCILPVLAVTALAIKIDSPGPILFKQQRIGLRGEPFSIYKFRSMYINAEEKLLEVMGDSGGMQLFYKSKDDPRITRVGRFIRRYSIDELPQLWNVFNGTMSMVGPRPQIDKEVELYDDSMHRRLYVKPGITGLWQVSGRSDLDAEQSIRLDLYYVENWSLGGR
ncbi:exopolysaccharide biosynthesis polyprenyl glycosylphosphotransferase [Arthrobacter sp. VKM Ac-2550]|nr:exopolysaccharide biosynthesis polyprenyl glycosylphosphotransferase [Arthrobacter sp. VKM Ac-2550]